jgi:hypothetical protein
LSCIAFAYSRPRGFEDKKQTISRQPFCYPPISFLNECSVTRFHGPLKILCSASVGISLQPEKDRNAGHARTEFRNSGIHRPARMALRGTPPGRNVQLVISDFAWRAPSRANPGKRLNIAKPELGIRRHAPLRMVSSFA